MPVSNDGMNVRIDDVIVEAHLAKASFETNAGHAWGNGATGIAGDDLRRAQIIAHAIELLEFAKFSSQEQPVPQLLEMLDELAQYAESSTLENDELPDCATNALVLCDTLIRDPTED